MKNPFGAESKISTKAGDFTIYRLNRLAEQKIANLDALPFSIKILLESCLRNLDGFEVTEQDVTRLAKWDPKEASPAELPFTP